MRTVWPSAPPTAENPAQRPRTSRPRPPQSLPASETASSIPPVRHPAFCVGLIRTQHRSPDGVNRQRLRDPVPEAHGLAPTRIGKPLEQLLGRRLMMEVEPAHADPYRGRAVASQLVVEGRLQLFLDPDPPEIGRAN